MIAVENVDSGKGFDWGKTTQDYQKYRTGYPPEFYQILAALGVGLEGQRILDLGTGTGELALNFASQGAQITGIDISEQQIAQARQNASKRNLNIDFQAIRAEDVSFPDKSFDTITASMCWLYFAKDVMIPMVKRLLKPTGVLMTSSIVWLPFEDELAGKTEELILKYNPNWSSSGAVDGQISIPEWSEKDFNIRSHHKFKVEVPFGNSSWRGRLRANRGIGASLPLNEIEAFDQELDKLILEMYSNQPFTVTHRIRMTLFEVKHH
ncbi:MAG: class I SAM-dependent methyltransferase [Bacteroidota bacterium]